MNKRAIIMALLAAFLVLLVGGSSQALAASFDAKNLTNNAGDDESQAWSPDGTKIVFMSDRDGNSEIYVMSADGTGLNRLTNNSAVDGWPAWSPDGTKIAFVSNRDVNLEVYVMNADGTGLNRLTNNSAVDGGPSWSPDGTKIAFVSDRDGDLEVYVMSADGTGQNRLTDNSAWDGWPAWSPDGTKIAFVSNRDVNFEVYVMKADGTGTQTNLSSDPADDAAPSWSPDGSKIAFQSDRDGDYEIHVMNADGTGLNRLTNNSGWDGGPVWSPDGTKIAFQRHGADREIYVMGADGSGQTNLTNNPAFDYAPKWTPDGAKIAFASDRDGNYEIYAVDSFISYYFPWYDSAGMRNWVLMANPAGAGRPNLQFDLNIAKWPQSLGNNFGLGAGKVPAGGSLAPIYPGLMGGPVVVTSQTGDKAIVSQRSLMGSSFEEVPAIEESRLSDRYVWAWYDQTPGMQNWVLVANPDPTRAVKYKITIAGGNPGPGSEGTIQPGSNATPSFPGVMGGPVEVKATYADDTPAPVVASQRVLSGGGSAFNEMGGTPYGELSSRYLWTWYDSAAGRNWMLIANPTDGVSELYYEIKIGNNPPISGGPIAPGANATSIFPGVMGGPVEVTTFANADHTTIADSIASQRILWGPSFGEVPGLAAESLDFDYHWTWYDQNSLGASNWILIANPTDATGPIYYEIWIGGSLVVPNGGPIARGANANRTFPGAMGGPVEVKTFADPAHLYPADSIASQRVLWNGYFNELLGTVLWPTISTSTL